MKITSINLFVIFGIVLLKFFALESYGLQRSGDLVEESSIFNSNRQDKSESSVENSGHSGNKNIDIPAGTESKQKKPNLLGKILNLFKKKKNKKSNKSKSSSDENIDQILEKSNYLPDSSFDEKQNQNEVKELDLKNIDFLTDETRNYEETEKENSQVESSSLPFQTETSEVTKPRIPQTVQKQQSGKEEFKFESSNLPFQVETSEINKSPISQISQKRQSVDENKKTNGESFDYLSIYEDDVESINPAMRKDVEIELGEQKDSDIYISEESSSEGIRRPTLNGFEISFKSDFGERSNNENENDNIFMEDIKSKNTEYIEASKGKSEDNYKDSSRENSEPEFRNENIRSNSLENTIKSGIQDSESQADENLKEKHENNSEKHSKYSNNHYDASYESSMEELEKSVSDYRSKYENSYNELPHERYDRILKETIDLSRSDNELSKSEGQVRDIEKSSEKGVLSEMSEVKYPSLSETEIQIKSDDLEDILNRSELKISLSPDETEESQEETQVSEKSELQNSGKSKTEIIEESQNDDRTVIPEKSKGFKSKVVDAFSNIANKLGFGNKERNNEMSHSKSSNEDKTLTDLDENLPIDESTSQNSNNYLDTEKMNLDNSEEILQNINIIENNNSDESREDVENPYKAEQSKSILGKYGRSVPVNYKENSSLDDNNSNEQSKSKLSEDDKISSTDNLDSELESTHAFEESKSNSIEEKSIPIKNREYLEREDKNTIQPSEIDPNEETNQSNVKKLIKHFETEARLDMPTLINTPRNKLGLRDTERTIPEKKNIDELINFFEKEDLKFKEQTQSNANKTPEDELEQTEEYREQPISINQQESQSETSIEETPQVSEYKDSEMIGSRINSPNISEKEHSISQISNLSQDSNVFIPNDGQIQEQNIVESLRLALELGKQLCSNNQNFLDPISDPINKKLLQTPNQDQKTKLMEFVDPNISHEILELISSKINE